MDRFGIDALLPFEDRVRDRCDAVRAGPRRPDGAVARRVAATSTGCPRKPVDVMPQLALPAHHAGRAPGAEGARRHRRADRARCSSTTRRRSSSARARTAPMTRGGADVEDFRELGKRLSQLGTVGRRRRARHRSTSSRPTSSSGRGTTDPDGQGLRPRHPVRRRRARSPAAAASTLSTSCRRPATRQLFPGGFKYADDYIFMPLQGVDAVGLARPRLLRRPDLQRLPDV